MATDKGRTIRVSTKFHGILSAYTKKKRLFIGGFLEDCAMHFINQDLNGTGGNQEAERAKDDALAKRAKANTKKGAIKKKSSTDKKKRRLPGRL